MVEFVKIVKTCPACPSQWDAWESGGKYWYIRYRFGRLTTGHKPGLMATLVLDISETDHLSGEMSTDEILKHLGATYNGPPLRDPWADDPDPIRFTGNQDDG